MRIHKKVMRIVAFTLMLTVLTAWGMPYGVITAEAKAIYHITAKAAAGGGITDEGTHTVRKGRDKSYNIYPDPGYRVNYVTIDGRNIGVVTEYTFENVEDDHEICVYFISASSPDPNAVSKKNLNVLGSFSLENGSGSYAPNAKVTVDAGAVAGFSFGGWLASDGKIYPSAKTTITMPNYDLILYANWVADGTPGALNQIATTNLKGEQALGWTAITEKLATFTNKDLQKGSGSTMNVSMAGYNCYVDMAAIATLNARPGMALNIAYGADVSFTFFGDVDNSLFMGTELSYTSTTKSTGAMHEKEISFAEQGAIGTGISANVLLSEAVAGQTVNVYLVDASGNEALYMAAVVDAANRIAVPLSAKLNFKVKY